MQLRSVRLRNLRSYESAGLELGPGTTLLVGDVGSGKTSLLYAIEMALFGFAVVDPTHLVRHGAVESEVGLTLEGEGHRYEFSRRFRRKLRRGRAVFEVDEIAYARDGAKTAFSTTEIRQRVIELLGFPDNPNPRAPSALWRWAVYVPQEAMREVLAQEPGERLETVRKALGLEQYKAAAENAGVVATEIRHRADLRQERAGELALFEEKAPLLRARISELKSRLEALNHELVLRQQESAAAESALSAMEALRRTLDQRSVEQRELSSRLSATEEADTRLGERIGQLERELDAVRRRAGSEPVARATLADAGGALARAEAAVVEADRARDRAAADARLYAGAAADLRNATDSVRAADGDLGRARQELADAQNRLDRASGEGPRHEPPTPTPRSLSEIDAALEQARVAYETALDDSTRAKHILGETEELLRAGVCPRCGQNVRPEEFDAHRREQAERARTLETTLAGGRARLAELQGERGARERYERALQAWVTVERTRAELGGRRDRAESAVAASAERRTDAGRNHERAAEREAELRPSNDRLALADRARSGATDAVQSARVRLRDAQVAVDAIQLAEFQSTQLIESIGVARSEQDLLRAERLEAQRRIDESRGASTDMVRRLVDEPTTRERLRSAREAQRTVDRDHARTLVEVERAEAELSEAERSVARRALLLGEAGDLRQLAAWLSGAFRESILKLEGRLLARARAEFERHLTRFFAVLVEDPSMMARCDATFSPLVEIEGEPTPAEALSGGERTALALAFRLALGLVVRATGHLALDTLVLDEPTDGFSPEQVTRMGDLLELVAVPQVILVSHEAQLASAADRVVRVRKDNGRSILVTEPALGSGSPASPPPRVPEPMVPGPARRARSPRLDLPGPAPVS